MTIPVTPYRSNWPYLGELNASIRQHNRNAPHYIICHPLSQLHLLGTTEGEAVSRFRADIQVPR
ncbi:hypothetical protein MAE02_54800 [Microvirga aerophila]|uniref:Uncharacterized protein n=1 Tax=Microvirga aerophila TaxID=670291 RepID=A0A512C0P0_9HYPH|nr:hypothetical protein MAE02_54800 [Microvirga aerophila]